MGENMFLSRLQSILQRSVHLISNSSRAFILSAAPILLLTYGGYALAFHYLSRFVPSIMIIDAIRGTDPIKLEFIQSLGMDQQLNLLIGCLVFMLLLSLYYVGFTVQWARYALYGEKPSFNLQSFRGKPAKQYMLFMLLALVFFTIGMTVLQAPVWVVLNGYQHLLSTKVGALVALFWLCVFGGYLAWFLTKTMLITIAACGDGYRGLVTEFKRLDDVFWAPFVGFVALLVVYWTIKLLTMHLVWVSIAISPIVGLWAYATAILIAADVYKTVDEKRGGV
jgi:hypothetical protein